jgi:uncharacterized glyoxalase superfamily protein PhnB
MADVFPGLRYRDPAAAIEWLTRAFGLREHFVSRAGNGTIQHAELAWGDGYVMFGGQSDGSDGRLPLPDGPGQLYLVVAPEEMDAHYQRAVDAGATVMRKLEDHGYDRGYTVTDPEGNAWSFGSYRPTSGVGG